MTAATLSSLPIAAGGALAGSLARGVYWTLNRLLDAGFFVGAQFMRAPIAITTIAAIAGFSLLAGSNALYFQANRHPAPLFFSPVRHAAPAPVVRPVIPATRPRPEANIDNETTGSLGNAAAEVINRTDVAMLQTKLIALKLLDGATDGIFGRHTAEAIKAFETRAGMKPRGKLTPQLLAAVMAAPVPTMAAAPRPAPIASPLPPAPLPAAVAAVPVSEPGRPVPLAPLRPESAAPPQVARTLETQSGGTPVALAAAEKQPAAEPASIPAAATDSTVVTMNSPPPNKFVADSQPAPVAAQPQPAVATGGTALTPAQRLAAQIGTLPPEATAVTATPAAVDTSSDPGSDVGSTDPALITKIQRGLASLGFLGQKIDGVPGEGTAKAIRNFEVFYDYKVTGLATPQLLNLLVQHGAET